MAHLIFRCPTAGRIITTGIEIDAAALRMLYNARTMPCRFCEKEHTWEVLDQAPEVFALMSIKAEDYLGRAIQSEAYAAQTADPEIREMYMRMANQWYDLAAESEVKADALKG